MKNKNRVAWHCIISFFRCHYFGIISSAASFMVMKFVCLALFVGTCPDFLTSSRFFWWVQFFWQTPFCFGGFGFFFTNSSFFWWVRFCFHKFRIFVGLHFSFFHNSGFFYHVWNWIVTSYDPVSKVIKMKIVTATRTQRDPPNRLVMEVWNPNLVSGVTGRSQTISNWLGQLEASYN